MYINMLQFVGIMYKLIKIHKYIHTSGKMGKQILAWGKVQKTHHCIDFSTHGRKQRFRTEYCTEIWNAAGILRRQHKERLRHLHISKHNQWSGVVKLVGVPGYGAKVWVFKTPLPCLGERARWDHPSDGVFLELFYLLAVKFCLFTSFKMFLAFNAV